MALTNPSSTDASAVGPTSGLDLTDHEIAILRATRGYSKSTVAIAEEIGLGRDPLLVAPMLERLEQLELLDGFYAAGRVMTSANEIHRRYYKLTDLGHQLL